MHFATVLLLFSLFLFSGCQKGFRTTVGLAERPSNAIQAPAISDLFASAVTTDSSAIMWRTAKPADSSVAYGESPSSLSETAGAGDAVVEHAVALKNLKPATKYYFVVTSRDSLGQSVSSGPQEFTTESLSGDTAGPAVSNGAVSPNPTAGATLVSLSAVVSDANTGGKNVTAAEYFIDTQGTSGTGTAMAAQDGSFNSSSENVNAVVNIAGVAPGTHRIYLHGRDASNNWGGFVTIDLSVTAGSGGDVNGPLTSGLSVSPNPTAGAGTVNVTAQVSDAGTGGANVTAAEYFIDVQGVNGSGTAMSAADGSYNSSTENASATIDVSGLSQGTYRIYVHGRDAQNNWGGFQFIDLSVTGASGVSKPDVSSLAVVHYGISFSGDKPQEAIWIEDEAGNFIRTLFISSFANSNTNTLPTWENKSGGRNDGTTGATKSAGSYNANWSMKDTYNATVSPGNYRYRIEVRQRDRSPSVYTGVLSAGSSPSSSSATGGSFVTSLSADYTP